MLMAMSSPADSLRTASLVVAKRFTRDAAPAPVGQVWSPAEVVVIGRLAEKAKPFSLSEALQG